MRSRLEHEFITSRLECRAETKVQVVIFTPGYLMSTQSVYLWQAFRIKTLEYANNKENAHISKKQNSDHEEKHIPLKRKLLKGSVLVLIIRITSNILRAFW